jgi:hypothetical protein
MTLLPNLFKQDHFIFVKKACKLKTNFGRTILFYFL